MPSNIYVSRGSDTIPTTVSGDSVFFLGGSAGVVNGLDLSGLTGIVNLVIGSDFTGQIGDEANPLRARVTTKISYGASGGDFFFRPQGSGASDSALLVLFGDGHFHLGTAGTLTRAEVTNGQMTISALGAATTVRLAGGVVNLLGIGGTAPTLLKNTGGYCYTERGATTIEHGGGHTRVQASTNTIGTLTINGPGVELVECGTITELNVYGGIPDMRRLVRPLTITNCNINMCLPGSQAFLDSDGLSFSFTPIRMFSDGSLPSY